MKKETASVLSAHPIEPKVREKVLESLTDIEAKHDVKILFACESGSRGWGFASPDSDYDVRFVYVHRLSWYLTVEPGRDVIELPISDELDVSGWDLRKALYLLHRSNPTLLEWLDSPVIYRQDESMSAELRNLVPKFFSAERTRYHYLSMAKKNFHEHLQGDEVRLKKYLYALRPLLAMQWVDRGLGFPPMRFADLAERLVSDQTLLDEINQLLEIKMQSGEREYSPRWEKIHHFIESQLATDHTSFDYKKPDGSASELDALLMRAVTQF